MKKSDEIYSAAPDETGTRRPEYDDSGADRAATPPRRKYILNPLVYYFGSNLPQIILLPLLYMRTVPQIVDQAAYLQTFLLSILNMVCLAAGYMLAPRVGQRIVHRALAAVTLRFSGNALTYRERAYITRLLVCLFFAAFAVHMVVSGGGLLWITNSRVAYATYRIGVGPTYGICLIMLYLGAIFSMFSIPLEQSQSRIIRQIVLRVCLFSFCAYFLGSKGYIISIALIGMLFYNYNVRPVRLQTLIVFASVVLCAVVGLLFLQGTSSNSDDVVSYADYFHNTSEFLRRFNEFGGYRWGAVTLSDLWSYVPRGLYPNKPYEYGIMVLDQLMFPGAAETGYTPAFLPWATIYLDFGIAGVVALSLYGGLFLGWLHTYYANRPPSVVRFVVLIQLCYVGVFPFIPLLGILVVVLPLFVACLMLARHVLFWLRVLPPAAPAP